MSRPTNLTDAVQRYIIDAMLKGAHPRQAARSAGVPDSTFSGWLVNPGARFERFRNAMARAEAQAEIEAVDELRRVDKRWWLERRHRERWGKPAEVVAQAAVLAAPASPSQEMVSFTPEEIRAAAEALLDAKRRARGETARDISALLVAAYGPEHPAEE